MSACADFGGIRATEEAGDHGRCMEVMTVSVYSGGRRQRALMQVKPQGVASAYPVGL